MSPRPQHLRLIASTPAQLSNVESLLGTAVAIGEGIAVSENGLLVSINKACAAEAQSGEGARAALAMLMCQAGGRDREAGVQLKSLGFKFRLASQILHYADETSSLDPGDCDSNGGQEGASNGGSSSGFVSVMDHALPLCMLQQLQSAFEPDSRFWAQHGYGRVGYFSYMHEVVSLKCNGAVWEEKAVGSA